MSTSAVSTAEAVAERALGALVGAKVEDGSAVGWPAWALTDPSIPARMAVDDVTLYNGDAGIAWALAGLGQALDRRELTALAGRAATRVLGNPDALSGGGLLAGRAGGALAAYSIGLPGGAMSSPRRPMTCDLTDGAAGVLLAQVRTGAAPDHDLVRALARRASAQEVGWAWADALSESSGGRVRWGRGRPGTATGARRLRCSGWPMGLAAWRWRWSRARRWPRRCALPWLSRRVDLLGRVGGSIRCKGGRTCVATSRRSRCGGVTGRLA